MLRATNATHKLSWCCVVVMSTVVVVKATHTRMPKKAILRLGSSERVVVKTLSRVVSPPAHDLGGTASGSPVSPH